MPSSYEPCGISQMLAMRRGQPCVAHAIGGLRDTIRDGETGFLFDGSMPDVQADAFGCREDLGFIDAAALFQQGEVEVPILALLARGKRGTRRVSFSFNSCHRIFKQKKFAQN